MLARAATIPELPALGSGVRPQGKPRPPHDACARMPRANCPQVGDWGREGSANQRLAAELMAGVARCMPPKFVISTGDNIYPR